MRRPVFRRSTTSLALFPFLAVLICTMGALIVLLVLILQQTRASAAVAAAAEQTAATEARQRDDAELQQRRLLIEDAQWRAQVLDEQRRKQTEDLFRGRLELSHLEDHIRRLQDQAKQLGNELKQSATDKSDEERAKMVEDLARLTNDIEAARKKLQDAQVAASKKNKSFTIIPYEGRQGTRRRPIYIECAEEGIILHPEGIVFQPSDFNGPLGPGNPLDAALRTVREYLTRYGDPSRTGEPYPLLIVRPNGAVAYAMARAAMKSWDDEFGYELIDGEMSLQFPPSDPQLEQLLMRTLKDARHRQTVLAASMPSRYKVTPSSTQETVPAQSFAAAPANAARSSTPGGFGVGGSGTGPGAGAGTGTGFAPGGGGGNSGSSGTGSGTQRAATGRLPGPGGSGGGTGTGGGDGTGSGSGTASGGSGTARGYADQAGGANGDSAAGGAFAAGSGRSNNAGGQSGSGANGGAGGTEGGVNGTGGASGGPGASGGASGGAGGSTAGPGMMAASGGSPTFVSGATSPGGSASAADGASSANSSSGASMSRGSGSRGSAGNRFTADGAAQGKEGEWALPGKPQRATAITRPIRIRCEPHRLVILPERGDSKRPAIVLVPNDMNGSLDDFVSAVRKHMDGWGLAVVGGYWKPVLNVTVAPGGETQFAELESLLRGSGIEVVRK